MKKLIRITTSTKTKRNGMKRKLKPSIACTIRITQCQIKTTEFETIKNRNYRNCIDESSKTFNFEI